MKQQKLHTILLALLYCCLFGGTLFFLTLHWSLPYIMRLDVLPSPGDLRYLITLCCWYIGTAGALVLLIMLTRMAKTLSGNPFIRRNVLYMRHMGFIAIGMSFCSFLAAAMYGFRPLLLIIGMMEVFCATVSLVLSSLFEKAVEYKDENELVI